MGVTTTNREAHAGGSFRERTARGLVPVGERAGSFWTFGVLAIIVIAFCVTTPNFMSKAAWVATSLNATEILILALGQTFVIISRGIDLSVGAVLGLSAMISAWVMKQLLTSGLGEQLNLAIGFIVCIAVASAMGAVNGLVVTRLNVNPFVATLGMLGVARGAILLVNNAQELTEIPPGITKIGNTITLWGWVPVPVLISAVLALAAALTLHYTRFGRHTYAAGSNPEAAARTGIDLRAHLLRVYTLSGAFAGVSGFLVMAQLSVASVEAGRNDELAAIAAVVIGGGSLFGGRGNIAGAIVGTLIITVLQTGLVVANVQAAWQLIAVGAILVGAVWADQQRLKLARRS
jgi:ribose transport system permease protein